MPAGPAAQGVGAVLGRLHRDLGQLGDLVAGFTHGIALGGIEVAAAT